MNELTCEFCGKRYFRTKNGKASAKQRFCSPTCKGAAFTASRGGFTGLLEANKSVNPDNGCWEWAGELTAGGYGRLVIKRKRFAVHRVAAAEWLGLDLNDATKLVCHHCDNPKCFNPEHLYIGTQVENMRDKFDRARDNTAVGEQTGHSKLTDKIVLHLREKYSEGASYKELAAFAGCCQGTAKEAVKGITWKHLPMVPMKARRKTALRSDNTLGFKGIRLMPKTQRWAAYIFQNGKQKHLGMFDDAESAARTYDAAAIELFGTEARLNFV